MGSIEATREFQSRTLGESGLTIFRRARGNKIIRYTGNLATRFEEEENIGLVKVREPIADNKKSPIIQLLGNVEVRKNGHYANVPLDTARSKLATDLPKLNRWMNGIIFDDVDINIAPNGVSFLELQLDERSLERVEEEVFGIKDTLDGLADELEVDWVQTIPDNRPRSLTVVGFNPGVDSSLIDHALGITQHALPLKGDFKPATINPKR